MVIADIEPLSRISRDIAKAGVTLGPREARFLVDTYYQMQDYRIQANGQIRAIMGADAEEVIEPNAVLRWQAESMEMIENQIKLQLGKWAKAQRPGRWALSITGIGPVIAAGLLSNIDIEKAPTVGHIWRYAGLDPTSKWLKGQKRPWNARLKVLTWKMGESFVKVQNNENDYYGKVFVERKALENARNDAGLLADQAASALTAKTYRKETEAYKAYITGKLPPAHIHARARRYASKLFLSHCHHVLYESHFGVPPPKPYIIEHGGHTHFLTPPNWPID